MPARGNLRRMAKPADNLRDAVERTVEATIGSAERSRSAAQGALDDLVDSVEEIRKGAEERLARGRKSMADAIEGRRPATYDDIKELRAELRAIGRRLDKIEERLPKRRSSSGSAKPSSSGSAKRSGSGSAKRGSSGSSKRSSKS
jgi:polyhydroxyalkanoate synthesis regulator phasin